jgi:hypothetical protein
MSLRLGGNIPDLQRSCNRSVMVYRETDVLLVRPMLELLALPLSVFASLFKSTERLEAKTLVVPPENLILYDEHGLLKGPVSVYTSTTSKP